jgi:hypothetical protein
MRRRYGTKCSGCDEGILPTNLVRRAKGMVFHVECFCCSMCLKEIATGDELYHVGGNKFVCKDDYDLQVQEIESKLKYQKHCSSICASILCLYTTYTYKTSSIQRFCVELCIKCKYILVKCHICE